MHFIKKENLLKTVNNMEMQELKYSSAIPTNIRGKKKLLGKFAQMNKLANI
jgi:hypothetical protein